ncbi:MAG: CoA transferase [Clostridiales bacterium]|nr:CoA transferase [Clostridiales bacterium]
MTLKLLEDVRVLDLTRLYPGPFCTMMMADMGAEVIKVESPGEGDYMRTMGPMEGEDSLYFRLLNRNKKSITLNLKSKKGVEVLHRLAATADVIVESFRPGVVDSLGVGYADLKKIKDDIIYCSITGYGQDGPYKDRAGHDLNYIALAGILDMTGSAGGSPAIPGVQLGDVGGGALMALSPIMAALYARSRGKGGCYIDVAMLDGLISWLPLSAAEAFAGNQAGRGSSALNGALACYNVYKTSDGCYMALGALEAKFWTEFCQAVGKEDWRAKHYQADQAALKKELADLFAGRMQQEWKELFLAYDCCCEPVLTINEAFTHPQVIARKAVGDNSLSFPIKISGETAELRHPAPKIGEHTEEVLCHAGFSREEVATLRENEVL